MKRKRRYDSLLGFLDFLLGCVMMFMFLFVLAIIFWNPEAKKEADPPNAQYMIVINWKEKEDTDIDGWLKHVETNTVVSYKVENSDFVHLDRDDVGNLYDTVKTDNPDESLLNPINREVFMFRNIPEGQYYFNVHFFSNRPGVLKTEVKAEIIRIYPSYKIITYNTVLLTNMGEEEPVFAFKVDDKRNIYDIDKDHNTRFVIREGYTP